MSTCSPSQCGGRPWRTIGCFCLPQVFAQLEPDACPTKSRKFGSMPPSVSSHCAFLHALRIILKIISSGHLDLRYSKQCPSIPKSSCESTIYSAFKARDLASGKAWFLMDTILRRVVVCEKSPFHLEDIAAHVTGQVMQMYSIFTWWCALLVP